MEHDGRRGRLVGDAGVDGAPGGGERPRPGGVGGAEVGRDGRQVDDGPGERVEQARGVARDRRVAQEQEALDAGLDVVGGELREVHADAGEGGQVEEAAAAAIVVAGAVDAVRQHGPMAGPEAGVQAAGAIPRVRGALPPLLARGAEADVLGHVVAEQPTGDVVDEL